MTFPKSFQANFSASVRTPGHSVLEFLDRDMNQKTREGCGCPAGKVFRQILVFCKTGLRKTGLSEQGYVSYMVHA